MSKLHIIIPIINGYDMTRKAIDTIQTKYDFQIHIIDQDSDQVTQDRLGEWQADYGKKGIWTWVHRYSPKVSLSEAWNRGIKEAVIDSESKYFFIINNDVLFHRNTIDNLIEAMDKTNYSMVTCNNIAPVMSESDFLNMEVKKDDCLDKPITNWREEGPDFSAFLINRQTIEDIGWFDENFYPCFYEDNDYHTRILKANKHAKRTSQSPYYHYGSMTARATGTNSGLGESRFIEKWGVMPEKVMDGQGFTNPYNEDKNYKYWRGVEKYNDIKL